MNRRSFLLSAAGIAALGLAPPLRAQRPPVRTQWRVRQSEGFDAVAFLGPLSGEELYQSYYAAELAQFAPAVPAAIRADLAALWREAGQQNFGLMGPTLQVFFSGGDASRDLASILAAIDRRGEVLQPPYRASPYWDEGNWAWFDRNAARLRAVFQAMTDVGFARFWAGRSAATQGRVVAVAAALRGFDVIRWQEMFTGRTFDPVINVVLLEFAKPHGIKVQGQTFLQSADYDTATTVQIAAHEMLHPPVPERSEAAQAALAVLSRDPLITRIVRDHDPRWGYTTLAGMLDEDLTQALDQMVSEAVGAGRNPAIRWQRSDDGMHVLAGGLYALLQEDGWSLRGGSIEQWLLQAARGGRLAPAVLHPAAARILGRPVDRLWPLAG